MEQQARKGINETFQEVLESIMKRDKNDMNKKVGALKRAPDAIYIDSSNLSIEQVKRKIINIIEKKQK